jgi:hypothetical protein
MPQCKALRTFESRYGFIRTGDRFSSEKGYAVELATRGLIAILPDTPEPARVQAFPGAPLVQGKEPPANPPPPAQQSTADRDTEAPPAAGAARPSALSRAAQALRRKTAPKSRAGAKRS